MKNLLFIIFFISTLIFTACFGKGYNNSSQKDEYYRPEALLDAEEPVTITVWHHYNARQKEKFDELVALFNETVGRKYDILVKSVRRAGNAAELAFFVKEALDQKIGADTIPDIFAAYPDTAFEFNKRGVLARLNEDLTQDEKDEYIYDFLYFSGFGIDDDIKLFPVAKATENFILNKTAWEPFAKEHNLSYDDLKTWEDIVRVAELYYNWTDKATAAINDGAPFFGRDSANNYMLVGAYELGSDMFKVSKTGEIEYIFDDAVLKTLWDNYYVPFVKGYFGAEGRFRSDDLKTGKIIACIVSTTASVYLPQTVSYEDGQLCKVELEILPLPHFKNPKRKAAVQQGSGMAVLKSSFVKELASVLFLKWFTAVEQNTEFAVDSGALPVKRAALLPNNIDSAIQSYGSAISKYIAPSMKVSIQTILDSSLYFQPGFKNASIARHILYETIHTEARKKRTELQAISSNVRLYNETLQKLISDDSFAVWSKNLKETLNALK